MFGLSATRPARAGTADPSAISRTAAAANRLLSREPIRRKSTIFREIRMSFSRKGSVAPQDNRDSVREADTPPAVFPRSLPEGVEEVADLGFDRGIGRVLERGGDLGAEGLAAAPPEPARGLVDGGFAQAEVAGDLAVRDRTGPAGQHPLELLEQRAPAGRRVLGGQPVHGPAEQGQGPGPLEEPVGRLVRRLDEVASLGVACVDRNERPGPATFLGTVAVAAAVQEEYAIGAEEVAKAATLRVGGGEDGLLQEAGEILLGQVEGIGLAVAQRRTSV